MEKDNKEEMNKNENDKQDMNYVSMGISLGMCFGVAAGAAVGMIFGKAAIGMCFGIAIGVCLGGGVGVLVKKKREEEKHDKEE